MPLDYQTETGPRLACRFSMGEYNSRPSFLLQSQKGLAWYNIPPALEALVKMPNMDTAAKNFALGPRGLFWYTYRSVQDVFEQKGSEGNPSLWATLNEDWRGGCPIRLSFGSGNWFWGEKEWNEPGAGHLVQAFGVQPPTLIAESKKRFPGMKSYEIDFVSIGVGGCWIMGTQYGDPVWSGISPQLEKTLKRELAAGHKVKNVVLCPTRADIYWIEYSDGTIDYFLPTDWDLNLLNTHVTTHVNTVEDSFIPYQLPTPVKGMTTLRAVRKGGLAWNFVTDLFQVGWKHPHKQPAPPLLFVFEILLPENLHKSYMTYLDKIEKKYRYENQGLPAGNQAYSWHGTRRRCPLGETESQLSLCADTTCATCCILNQSFSCNYAGHAPGRNFLRFGKAIYVSSVSSKADDYASKTPAGYRSLLLTRIVKGNAEKRTIGDKKLTAPKAGYDCVEGLVGQELNYEETCLYNNDAVRPAFLVLYR